MAKMDDDETLDALAQAKALLGVDSDDEDDDESSTRDEDDESPASAALPGMEQVPNVPSTLDPDPPRRKLRGKVPNKKNPFKDMVGAGERLLIHKRDNLNGQLTYVGQYSPEDLMRSANVDIFLQEYVVPTWKEGEYQMTLLGTDGSQKPLGSRKIGAPPGSQGSERENSIKELFTMQQQMDAKAKEEAENGMKNMVAMMTMMKTFMPQPKESSGDGGMGMMMPMMMMMMMNQPKPSGPDPMMMMLLTKLLEKDNDPVSPPMPMQYPPMMPSSSPTENVAELAQLIQALKPAQTSTSVQDLASIAQMFQPKNDDKLTIKDLIALAPTLKDILGGGSKQNGSFAETVQNLGQLQQLLSGMNNNNGEQGTFWEFASGLAENLPALAAAIKQPSAPATSGAIATTPKPSTATTTKQAARKVPAIPDGFKQFSEKMVAASEVGEEDEIGDEEQLIEQSLRGLLFLRKESVEWRPYIDGFLTLVKDDNKEKALRLMEVFIRTFMDREFITDDCANSTYQALDENWDKVRIALGFKKPEPKGKNGKLVTANAEPEPVKPVVKPEVIVGGGGVEVTNTETVAEASRDDTDDAEVEDDDEEVEMSDEEIAALAEVVEPEDSPRPSV